MISICFDIGNTRNKLAIFEDDVMIDFKNIDLHDFQLYDNLFAFKKIDAAIISCVSTIPEALTSYLSQKVKINVVLDHNTKLPIENYYETKESLGKDRLAAVVGANFLYPGEDLLIIDAGTAITFDIINCKRQYLGGNISPGIQLRYKSLNTFTGKLPLLNNVEDFLPFGKNTHDAIKSGVLQGVVIEVDGCIDMFKQYYPGIRTLFTGGDATFFDNKLKNVIFVIPNLVMVGLNRILAFNYNSCDKKN